MSIIYPKSDEDYLYTDSIKPSRESVLRKEVEDQLLVVRRLHGELNDLNNQLRNLRIKNWLKHSSSENEAMGIFKYESEWGSYYMRIKLVSIYELNEIGLEILDFAKSKHYKQYLHLKKKCTLYYHIMLLQKDYDSQFIFYVNFGLSRKLVARIVWEDILSHLVKILYK